MRRVLLGSSQVNPSDVSVLSSSGLSLEAGQCDTTTPSVWPAPLRKTEANRQASAQTQNFARRRQDSRAGFARMIDVKKQMPRSG